MKYWGLLAGKLAAAALLLAGLWRVLLLFRPVPERYFGRYTPEPFWFDLRWTFAVLVFGLLCVGAAAAIFIDQRYRCRTCARRLRMPVLTGSWSNMLLDGRPRTERICPYGHGSLKNEEVQIDGLQPPSWKRNGDIWEELTGGEKRK